MHGRKREEYKARLREPKVAAGLAHKAQQWNSLMTTLLQQRQKEKQALQALADEQQGSAESPSPSPLSLTPTKTTLDFFALAISIAALISLLASPIIKSLINVFPR